MESCIDMRKRSHLTLYKKKVPFVSRFTKPRHDFHKISKGTGTSSKKSRFISPASTPSGCTPRSKRVRIASPLLYAKKITASPLRTRTPPSIQHEHADHEEWEDLGSTEITVNCDDDCNLFKMFKNELVAAELWDVFRIFMNQVASTLYPLTNIALLLFLDTVKFYNCRTTTQMTYSSTSKRFWKTGYRLFHAKFLYFMSGPRNIVDNTENTTSCIDPQTSRINFAVPNTKTLEAFTLTEADLPKIISPGIIEPIMKSITETVSDKRFMLCADAKKVTSGVDKKGGDVDMFGFEDGDSLQQRRNRLSNEIEVLQQVVTSVNETPSDKQVQIINNVRLGCTLLGERVFQARDMESRQKYGLKKFMSLGGATWRDSKYVYAISALHTSLYQLKDFIRNALHGILQLCKVACLMANGIAKVQDVAVTKWEQSNMVFLNPNYQATIMETMYIIQRSEMWLQVRKLARVTGSTIHNAIGLRGAKYQKRHISLLNAGNEDECSVDAETIKRMKHGTDNEQNALATLAGVVVPTFYPNCCYVEEGCYITQGMQQDILLVVSPDGSLRECIVSNDKNEKSYTMGKVIAAVEVKCPFPKESGVTVHYTLPQYYVCQCLAEMHALNTDKLLYMSWTDESSVVLEVKFDKELWLEILSMISEIYDCEIPKRLADGGPRIKALKENISKFIKTHVTLLGEFPSIKLEVGNIPTTSENQPYIYPMIRDTSEQVESICTADINCAALRGIELLQSAYELQRRKATEVMVWVLTHINRDTTTEIPCSIPIAYGLKDYKLTASAMRNATNYVIQKCVEQGIKVCSLSTDGQWIQMMNHDSNGLPTTRLQHQKQVWKTVQQLTKPELVKRIVILNRVDCSNDLQEQIHVEWTGGKLQLRSKDGSIAKIKTPDAETWHSLLVSSKKKTKSDSNEDDPQYASTNTHVLNWIPEQLVQVMEETDDNSVKDVVLSVDQELTQSFSESIRPHSDITDNNSETKYDESVEELNDVHQASSSTDASTSYDIVEVIENDLHQIIGECPARIDLIHMLNGVKDLSVLTHKVLDIITAALIRERKSSEVLRKSWKKDKKIDLIRHVYNQARDPLVASKRKKNPPRLSSLCEQIIKSQKMPKSILNVVYATYIYDIEYQAWVSNLPQVPLPRLKEGNRDPLVQFWYSFPEQICDQFIGKGTDCSHNLTHLRVRSCTTGIAEVSNKAWISAAKSNETCLNSALVEDLIDKQSVPNARTNFCEEVEDWMTANGYKDASELTNLIRCWYDACDSPGISAEVRVESLLRMRNFLLRGVDFGKFPPPSRYINKIPVVSFEGILIDIDTKIQSYIL